MKGMDFQITSYQVVDVDIFTLCINNPVLTDTGFMIQAKFGYIVMTGVGGRDNLDNPVRSTDAALGLEKWRSRTRSPRLLLISWRFLFGGLK